jgi:hypothetical protein
MLVHILTSILQKGAHVSNICFNLPAAYEFHETYMISPNLRNFRTP